MKPEEMIKGEYYYWELPESWMGIFDRLERDTVYCQEHVCLKYKSFYRASNHTSTKNMSNIRLMTFQEKQHFLECVKTGGYVDAPKIDILQSIELY